MEKAMQKRVRWYLSYEGNNLSGSFDVLDTLSSDKIQALANEKALQGVPIEYKNRGYFVTWNYVDLESDHQ